jgi:protein-disulfide isomerase
MELLAALCAAILAVPAAAYENKTLEEHLRESYQIPAEISISLAEPKGSEVPGFDKIQVAFNHRGKTQVEDLYLSKDGKHYILGGFRDLSVFPSEERVKKMDLKDSPVRGKPDAPVTVVQFTDFQCHFCKVGFTLMRDQVMKDFDGKARWVYKSMPLGFHDWAEPAAVAVECAKLQGQEKFWKMHDIIFDHQGDITLEKVDAKMKEYAAAAGVNEKDFGPCYSEKKTALKVKRDAEEALSLGINGTPAFVINGRLISGADSDAIRRTIEDLLKKKG